eukprot:TRINITY_DN77292_c0_g1_i1.p1 TRINITY_DN77292_c0_g1~~TRINITY_DN77292_c0_g1_i1.p1  ORF type:complete len:304 (-),score=35.21 TRINITY_DN77292_c0_g1_i1:200-1111(-)
MSSLAIQFIPSHEGYLWFYMAPFEGGLAEQVLGPTSQTHSIMEVKLMRHASGGARCQMERVAIEAKINRLDFLHDCDFQLGKQYRVFILVEDGNNRHDGTLKTMDFHYQGEMTLKSAISFSMPVPSSDMWRVIPVSHVPSNWVIHRLRFYSDIKCTKEVAVFPYAYSDPFASTLREDEPLPNGAAFSDPGPLPRATRILSAGREAELEGWTSGKPCAPGGCHIGFSFNYPFNHAGSEQRSLVQVGCAEVQQSDVEGEFAEALELQYFQQGVGYVSYRKEIELRGGMARLPDKNGTINLHTPTT